MYKRCIAEQSARRQRELEQGLLEIMATRRYEDITIMELCSWLDIPRKAFYRYFSSKERVVRCVRNDDHGCPVVSEPIQPFSAENGGYCSAFADPATGFGACRAWNGRGVMHE